MRIPNLSTSECLNLTACGELAEDRPELAKYLAKKSRIVATLMQGETQVLVGVISGGYSEKHFHVDIARSSFFPASRIPKATTSIEEIEELYRRFEGVKVQVSIIATFEVPIADLPENGLIRGLTQDFRSGDLGMRLLRGGIDIRGGALESFDWEVQRGLERVRVTIEAQRSETIDDNYLVRLVEWSEIQFGLMVKGVSSGKTKTHS
ncbi:MAG: hypothetical protein HUU46_03120 [Candidatus Hydrogenedentes bacterium]|nr:hypothetical protein [Candidatus Hydrogenedentota bacterium]